MIDIVGMDPNGKYIEFGGGANPKIHPNVDVRQCFDDKGQPTVDFTADFEKPLLIGSAEFDGVYMAYSLEHISWPNLPNFLKEVFRILKPGGSFAIVTANTLAQLQWVLGEKYQGKKRTPFEECSCILFGSCDYPENSHKSFFSPSLLEELLKEAGFQGVKVSPCGEEMTDMFAQAWKPKGSLIGGPSPTPSFGKVSELKGNWIDSSKEKPIPPPVTLTPQHPVDPKVKEMHSTPEGRKSLFDKVYFNGGAKFGGYAREGYWDYPIHQVTFQEVMKRKPSSVLELGCARGYVLKRLEDAGVRVCGLEISKHCFMTRAVENIANWDICTTPWPVENEAFDLCFSQATLEHIPSTFLKPILSEIKRTCKRALFGVDFGTHDDGFDKTHVNLRSREQWVQLPWGIPVEIVDKESLETGNVPEEYVKGDGTLKLNIGCFATMFHHGWVNIDIQDMSGFANAYSYKFQQCDVLKGIPYGTGTVDAIFLCHFLEHLTYEDGFKFLCECRRVLRPTGIMRILVPDADFIHSLLQVYSQSSHYHLEDFDEVNDGCAKARTATAKVWALLHEGHASAYDAETLGMVLNEAGFFPGTTTFRKISDLGMRTIQETGWAVNFKQLLEETLDLLPCLTLYMDAMCKISGEDSKAG